MGRKIDKECGACGCPEVDDILYTNDEYDIYLCDFCKKFIHLNGFGVKNENRI